MAKSGSKSRKGSARGSRAKKTTRRTARSPKRAAPAPSRVLDLKRLRRELDLAVSVLSRRVEKSDGPSAKLTEAQTLLARWASDIDDICDPDEQDICGPTMDIPLN